MRPRAFTLLELLITTAILGLLLAITLPAIAKTQTAARRATCATHLKALALAANAYAQDNAASLPPGPREIAPDGRFAKDPDRGSPLELFSDLRIGRPDLSSQNGWYAQGLLWRTGALAEPRFFYCPEMERRGWGFALAWPRHWDRAPDRAGEKSTVTGSYAYLGGYASAAPGPDGPLNLFRSPPGEPIFADSPLLGTMIHPGGYSVAFLGGQAEFLPSNKPLVTGTLVAPLWKAARQSTPASAPANP